ncbi:MAG: glycosyltransferase [Opitutaceae bacterium]|jgi:GT2 family glycosyltransferase
MNDLLVVTPTLGTSDWLDETVASVAGQPLACRHVLVAPTEAAAALAARFPTVQVVPERGGGMYAAINAGLAAARDWNAFTYLNDDDVLLPHFAAVARTAARAAVRPLIVYGRVRLIDAQGRRLGAIPVSPAPSFNRALYAQRIEPVYQHGTLVTRAALESLGGFDESLRFCGDSEFLARACVTGVPFSYVGGAAVAAFRLRAGQLTKNRAALLAERTRIDQKLGLLGSNLTFRHRWARLIFRAANAGVYAERIARHGFVTFDELLARIG